MVIAFQYLLQNHINNIITKCDEKHRNKFLFYKQYLHIRIIIV